MTSTENCLEDTAVPMLVLSPGREIVEAINGLLRRGGMAAHCTWVPGLHELAASLVEKRPHLLLFIDKGEDSVSAVAHLRDQVSPGLPLLVVRDELDETQLARDLEDGAKDSVSFAVPTRFQSVIERELQTRRIESALDTTLRNARDSRRQLETVLSRSNDAIGQVQEGILVDANATWLELFGYDDVDDIAGQPIMDLVDEESQPTIRGALIACLGGRWSDHGITVRAIGRDGTRFPLELNLALGERDGESCIRLIVPAPKREERHLEDDLVDAVRCNPRTGLLYRPPMLEAVNERLHAPLQGGRRFLLCIRPDHFAGIEHDLGVGGSEEFIEAFARLVKSQLLPHDLLGHFSGVGLMALLERGAERDAEAWAERLLDRFRREEFKFGAKSIKATVTVGLAFVPTASATAELIAQDALDALRRGRQNGGNQLFAYNRLDGDTRVQSYDAVWIKMIKTALMENRFRLVLQSIAGLNGQDAHMSDVLIRMIDPSGSEILPSEFLPPAERADMLKNIDRWVIGASLQLAAQRKEGKLFIRLSSASVVDPTLLSWLDAQIRTAQVNPDQLCIQIAEDVMLGHLQEVRRLSDALRTRGLSLAIVNFGVSESAASMLDSIKADYVKIDGSLLQGLNSNHIAQQRIGGIVAAAHDRKIPAIAERIEDANTMAVLWQLGVDYVQGFFLQQPEEVVLGDN
jgi:PAS domain S-box-containing protein